MELDEAIQVEVSDYLLTPLSCSSLLNEIIKCLLYQKSQIPYPYNWLKTSINRRRLAEKEVQNGTISKSHGPMNFTIENHFRIASKLFDDLEEAMKSLSKELCGCDISEIVILFGPTPLCPKEVCTLKIPPLVQGHYEDSHMKEALKLQHKVLRQIFLSDIWMDFVDSSIPCTSTYIFIKKEDNCLLESNVFKRCNPLNFQSSVKQYRINLKWKVLGEYMCCKNMKVYSDSRNMIEKGTNIDTSISRRENHVWYQFEHSIHGFKNCYINKTAACDMW